MFHELTFVDFEHINIVMSQIMLTKWFVISGADRARKGVTLHKKLAFELNDN